MALNGDDLRIDSCNLNAATLAEPALSFIWAEANEKQTIRNEKIKLRKSMVLLDIDNYFTGS
jgi:hypothetical protein